jgi:ketosteroid isomerase-like protein
MIDEASEANDNMLRGSRVALRTPSPRAGAIRTWDERFFVRFPGAYRSASVWLNRLPVRSRLRRAMVARRIARAYAAVNRRDFEVVLLGLDPANEYRPAADMIAPDQEPVFSGHDGYLEMWQNWLDVFEDLRFEPEEILDFGDRLLVTARQLAHGSKSGIAVGQPVFQLFLLRDGLVVWQRDFSVREEALEVAARRR